jgi:hypothetical protein
MLKRGTLVNVTIGEGPSSAKNTGGERDLELHQTRSGERWHFEMKAHIGADVDSKRAHSVVRAAATTQHIGDGGRDETAPLATSAAERPKHAFRPLLSRAGLPIPVQRISCLRG